MKNIVYVVNEWSDYLRVDHKNKRYVFLAQKPLRIDYTNDPSLVTYLLSLVQLRLVTAEELPKYGIVDEEPIVINKEEVVPEDSGIVAQEETSSKSVEKIIEERKDTTSAKINRFFNRGQSR
jgi:hypothetical protein